MILDKVANHLTVSGYIAHEALITTKEVTADVGVALVNSLTRMGALNVLDRTY